MFVGVGMLGKDGGDKKEDKSSDSSVLSLG
jgi:hypothetical protein